MRDSSEKDGNAETIMDYVISWCLRCATSSCIDDKPILHAKCRYMLAQILDLQDVLDTVEFLKVETWKQENNIDIWCAVEAKISGELHTFAILIEDKYYTGLHLSKDTDGEYRNQLVVYQKKFDAFYASDPDINKKYVLITLIEPSGPDEEKFHSLYDEAIEYGYKILTPSDLVPDCELTESDIFNEFWVRWFVENE